MSACVICQARLSTIHYEPALPAKVATISTNGTETDSDTQTDDERVREAK